ncbi:MAG: hypothetical protein IKJ63_04210 [Clostridia bacterium]|nr:hypothetical protein [Clostridia bacterium]
MKKPIRLLSLLLCLGMVLSCFAACGEATDDPSEEVTTEESTEPVVIELGAFIDKVYTIVEIDRAAGTCLALLLEDENSYKNGTYTQGRTYDIDSHELLTEIKYTRDAKKRLTKVVHTDAKSGDTVKTEEYSYASNGKMLSSVSRDANRMTIDSLVYTYNADGTYTVTTTKAGKLASIAEFDRTDKAVARTDYEYKADGTYTVRFYKDGRMTQYVTFNAEGNEATRAVYTYNPDGSYTVALYENGILKNQQTGTAQDVVTQPAETTTQEEKETLDANAPVVVPTTTPPTTNNNNNNDDNNNDQPPATRPTRPTEPPTTEAPATDASGGIDMLAQSRIFRSGEYCLVGAMEEGNEIMYMTVAITRNTMYTSMEVDFGSMMGSGSTGMTELGFLQTANGTAYMLEPKSKTYCSMDESLNLGDDTLNPGELFADIDMSEAFIPISENAQPDKRENAVVNGEMVTCFTFNTASGESVKHYVNDNGQLIRVEDFNADGRMIQMFDVESLSGNIAEYMRKIPSDYKKTDLMNMLIAMMGDYGTIIE